MFVIRRGPPPPFFIAFSLSFQVTQCFFSCHSEGLNAPRNLSLPQFHPFRHCEGLNVPKQSLTSCDNERMILLRQPRLWLGFLAMTLFPSFQVTRCFFLCHSEGLEAPRNLSLLQFHPFRHCEGLNVPKQSLTSCDNEKARLLRLRLAMTDCGDCFIADAPRNDAFFVIPSDSMSFFFCHSEGLNAPRNLSLPQL